MLGNAQDFHGHIIGDSHFDPGAQGSLGELASQRLQLIFCIGAQCAFVIPFLEEGNSGRQLRQGRYHVNQQEFGTEPGCQVGRCPQRFVRMLAEIDWGKNQFGR